jgi:hypothetical protein
VEHRYFQDLGERAREEACDEELVVSEPPDWTAQAEQIGAERGRERIGDGRGELGVFGAGLGVDHHLEHAAG